MIDSERSYAIFRSSRVRSVCVRLESIRLLPISQSAYDSYVEALKLNY